MDALDREIKSALAVDPSPEFLARVRARVASEPAPSAWGLQWLLMGAGAVATTIAIVAVLARVEKPASLMPVDRRPLAPASVADARSPGFATVGVSQTARRRLPRRNDPEVLVAASEVRGLRDLLAVVREGRVEFTFEDASYGAQEPGSTAEIVIPPIAIAALDPGTNSEGESQ